MSQQNSSENFNRRNDNFRKPDSYSGGGNNRQTNQFSGGPTNRNNQYGSNESKHSYGGERSNDFGGNNRNTRSVLKLPAIALKG